MATLKISDLEFAKKLTPTFRDDRFPLVEVSVIQLRLQVYKMLLISMLCGFLPKA